MNRIGRYLIDRPSTLHFIAVVVPVVFVAALIIALPLLLIPGYIPLLRETASQYTTAFIGAVVLGSIASICALLWAGRKTWLETADLFPSNQEETED